MWGMGNFLDVQTTNPPPGWMRWVLRKPLERNGKWNIQIYKHNTGGK
jgi:hypothetical protein